MEYETKLLNSLIIILLFLIPLMWLFNLDKLIVLKEIINYTIIVMSFCTTILVKLKCKLEKKNNTYIFFIISTFSAIVTILILSKQITSSVVANYISITILPITLIAYEELEISDRVLGLLILIFGIISFFEIGNLKLIEELSYLIIPILIFIINNEENTFIRIIYILITIKIPFLVTTKIYISIFILLSEMVSFANVNRRNNTNKFLIIYIFFLYGFIKEKISINLPVNIIMTAITIKGKVKEKKKILIITNNLNDYSLKNFINYINKKRYKIKIMISSDNKNNIISRIHNIIFSIFYYNIFDCSCSYDVDSKFSFVATYNSILYINNKNIKIENINRYRKIVCKTNEIKDHIIKKYKLCQNKCVVINNFINIDYIENGRLEKIEIQKKYNKVILLKYENMNINKIKKMIKLAQEIKNIEIWILDKKCEKYKKIIENNKISSKIKLVVGYNNPFSYISRVDYVLIDSKYGEYPNMCLEALLLSKNIIIENDSSDELTSISDYSFVVNKENLDEIKNIIVSKKSKSETMGNIDVYKIQKEREKKWEILFNGGM